MYLDAFDRKKMLDVLGTSSGSGKVAEFLNFQELWIKNKVMTLCEYFISYVDEFSPGTPRFA